MASRAMVQMWKCLAVMIPALVVSADGAAVRLEVQIGHSNAVEALALSPDKRWAITGSDGLITLWDVASQRQLFQVSGDWQQITSFAFMGERVLIGAHKGTKSGQMLDIRSRQVLNADHPILDICSSAPIALTRESDGRLALRNTGDWTELLDLHDAKTFSPSSAAPRLTCTSDGARVLIPMIGPDGLLQAQLWNLKSGTKVATFGAAGVKIDAMAISPNGALVATAGGVEGAIHLWNTETGMETAVLPGHGYASEEQKKTEELQKKQSGKSFALTLVRLLEFSPDSSLLASAGTLDGALFVWDLKTKKITSNFSGTQPVTGLNFSDDGQNLLEGGSYGGITVWKTLSKPFDDAAKMSYILSHLTREQLNSKTPVPPPPGLNDMRMNFIVADLGPLLRPREVGCLSPDGRYLFNIFDGEDFDLGSMKLPEKGDITYFDFKTGSSGRWAQISPVWSCAFSADSKTMALGQSDGAVSVWDLETHAKLQQLSAGASPVTAVALSPGGSFVVAGLYNGEASLLDFKGGRTKIIPGGPMPVQEAAFSADGRWIMAGRSMKKAQFFARYLRKQNDFHATGSVVLMDTRMQYGPHFVEGTFRSRQTSAFMESNSGILFADGKTVVSFDLIHKNREVRIREDDLIRRMAVSKAGDEIAITTWDGDLALWDAHSGKKIWNQKLIGDGYVESMYFTPNQKMLLVCRSDGVTQVLRTTDGGALATLALARDGKWVVADEEGRFDASSFDFGRLMHWISTDDPFKPLPLELFAREYFQPRLLGQILAGSPLPLIPPIANISREQPSVSIGKLEAEPGLEWEVTIPVQVNFPKVLFGYDDAGGEVRLFRNGKLVGAARQQEMKLVNGAGVYEFHHIRLPQSDYNSFSAYAFGKDGVKSATAYQGYYSCAKMTMPPMIAERDKRPVRQNWPEGRNAWLVNIGVSVSPLPELQLKYAANDAHQIAKILGGKLQETGQFEKVNATELVSDERHPEGASKAAIHDAFNRLKLHGMNEARPDDLVVISFSGHGYADLNGRFYLVPSDAGKSLGSLKGLTEAKRKQLLKDSISSDELSEWLKDIDSDHIVLIIDACQSAASIEGEGFRPGPMGSKGLGQLAYDKGIAVLAATQGDNFALESSDIGQGLLTYALTHDGLESQRADLQPKDGKITLAEWLHYAVLRVPELWRDAVSGGGISGGHDTRVLPLRGFALGASVEGNISEQPMLFDFSNAYNDDLLVAGRAETKDVTPDAKMLEVSQAFGGNAPCEVWKWKDVRTKPPDPLRIAPTNLRLIKKVEPVYPAAAKAARVGGTVELAVKIGKDGHVETVELRSGHPLLVNAAVDAVKQWVWSVPMERGVPKEVVTKVVVNFGLAGKR